MIHAQSTPSMPSPCVRLSVLIGDMVPTFLPIILGDIILLPNLMRLFLAGERKHPENIVQCVEKAAPKYINRSCCISCLGRRSAAKKQNKFRKQQALKINLENNLDVFRQK
jgi:hypothetical protein